MKEKVSFIPVAKPKLPTASSLSPYLQIIDHTNQYSNFGPLEERLRNRFAESFSVPSERVVTGANATVLLLSYLSMLKPSTKRYVVVPSWTFPGTVQSVILAGFEPLICDVDRETWAIMPHSIPKKRLTDIAAVLPVMPFGDVSTGSLWSEFYENNGIPVVLDAAACFDSLKQSDLPFVISLHATKVLPSAEGGLCVCPSIEEANRLRQTTNFGFREGNWSSSVGTNGKMSEYHAAIAHQSLDEWEDSRVEWSQARSRYDDILSSTSNIYSQSGLSANFVNSTMVVHGTPEYVSKLETELVNARIGSRRWWAQPIHLMPAFKQAEMLTNCISGTELSQSALGLPMYRGLTDEDFCRIESVLEKV